MLRYSNLEAEFKAYGDIFLQQDAGEVCRLVPVHSLYRVDWNRFGCVIG